MILVSGGAGFIGSHIVERLLSLGHEVKVLDDLSSGNTHVPVGVSLLRKDVSEVTRNDLEGIDTIYHLAAAPDVRSSISDPLKSFSVNVLGSFKLLEAARAASVKTFTFSSSGGTVYGDVIGTADELSPQFPISPYGASKAAFEMYLSAYAHSYDMNTTSLRLSNVIGPHSKRGVIWDFFVKLSQNPESLEILGDGNQLKNYIHVSDCVSAFITTTAAANGFQAYNVASDGILSVSEIAGLVSHAMGLRPKLVFSGGLRGWVGDVSSIRLSNKKLKKIGWSPDYTQKNAIINYVKWLIKTQRANI